MQRTTIPVTTLVILLSFSLLAACNRNEGAVTPAPPAAAPAPAAGQAAASGEALFKQYCSSCHPDGGNVSDPQRTLRGPALKRHGITSADDIVRIMRHPVSRMIRFDAATLSDRDARAIAEYILTTFR